MTDQSGDERRRRRLAVFVSLMGLIASALVVQLVWLMVFVPSREGGPAVVLPEVQRGSILDRKGRILAITTRLQRVSVWTPSVTSPEETSALLARSLGMDPATVRDIIRRRTGYAVVKRRVTAEESAALKKLLAEGKLAGVSLEDDFSRLYPQGRLASHVVGYVGSDNVPLDGIEYTFNDALAPQPVGTNADTVYGDQVFLTIDLDLQYLADRIARAAMEANNTDSLTIIVMDAQTGDILAYTSLPDFDPNEFQKESPRIDPATLVNRPVTEAYEPGSVFKIFSLSSLLQLRAITPDQVFACPGYYEKKLPNGTSIVIHDISAHGDVTPQQVIEFSCNVGAASASDGAEAQGFYGMLVRFGFGKLTGVPLQGETGGLLKPVSQWSARTKPTIAIGQEVSVSALQIVAAASALANGGVLLKPHLVRKVVTPQGSVVKEFGREPLWEVVSPDAARTMLSWMESATWPAGTAHRAAVDGLRISAKTGTAQVTDPQTGAYSQSDFVASMIGIFPTDSPRIIAYVVMQNPRGQSYYGSQVAAPVFRELAAGIADQLGLARAGTTNAPAQAAGQAPAPAVIGAVMPDLTGVPKKLLLPLLLRTDISVTINGSGYVASQDPPAGTRIEKGMTILLELR